MFCQYSVCISATPCYCTVIGALLCIKPYTVLPLHLTCCLHFATYFVHLLQLTYADIGLSLLLDYFIEHTNCGPVVERFPGVSSLKKSLENLPRIKEWVEKRPKTEY